MVLSARLRPHSASHAALPYRALTRYRPTVPRIMHGPVGCTSPSAGSRVRYAPYFGCLRRLTARKAVLELRRRAEAQREGITEQGDEGAPTTYDDPGAGARCPGQSAVYLSP